MSAQRRSISPFSGLVPILLRHCCRLIRVLSAPIRTQMSQEVLKATDSSSIHGSQVESGPTTPLPDKKLLVFILDRLQKKDTRGVFSEPVDPEELPDYHEIIENPMDFGTVRMKLDQGAYSNLEQFEKDAFLICSNAMQYNAPDTIYFRQARSIQELAKKDFDNLRQATDDCDPKPKLARRGRPPGKSMKKSIDGSPLDRVGPQTTSETTLASGGENPSLSNAYNLRRPASQNIRSSDVLNRAPNGSFSGETSWLSGWENEFPTSVLRSVQKYGMKQFTVDENRRDTYAQALASGNEPSMFTGLEGEWKQLVAVGVHFEHGYARSLARFAANLGPVAWKVASKKIGSVLPSGLKFGPGWIGENESSTLQQFSICERGEEKVQCYPASNDHTDRLLPQSTSGSNPVVTHRFSQQSRDNMESRRELSFHNELASLNSGVCGIRPVPPFLVRQSSANHSGKPSSTDTSMPSQMLGMVSDGNTIIHQMPIKDSASNEAKQLELSSRSKSNNVLGGEASWHGPSIYNKQVSYTFPSDLNVKLGAPGSPGSVVQIGLQQQPDLALQL
ncbi:PREDICTED: bromodomain-containing protein 9-like isoform X2 [Prunus mume]|uniref:Bromodomain-containing protein 9-like isoform X2 n=1 Tax=Prunus mume TaxID=102107 RepID=A0ABM0PDC5_PRUMU|nr:PREDICTED: bromodomain-containing protein 9-like isoform X2 [Prunus mume]